MKNLLRVVTVCFFIQLSLPQYSLFAQCNVNDRYDKIISGYHSSIALKDDGTFAVWGSYMQATGADDQLAPQNISSANYAGLTGTVYKAALGGKSSGTQVDQAFILTSTGLWAWGVAGNVVSTGVKSGNAFGRTSTASANGFNTYGLPSTLVPTDVASLFATYQSLVILTVSGNVWMLTQTSLAVEGNGGSVTTAGSSRWVQVKINATTYLTNVTVVRGQVSGNDYNAFIALTAAGKVYTWGNSIYLGDNTASTAKNFATQMTLPAEFSSTAPKIIGVTGGTTSTSTTKNTYYVLSVAGNLYSLGNNTQKQCGDFTTTERLSWVNVKKSAAANDNLANINFFSCQEHNSSYPGIAAITNTGTLYTWGNNSSGMIGRTDNGTATGGLTTVSFDPGIPVNFTGTAVFAEMGGHTMVYIKTGSTQFCYVGHYTNGSMGDGTSNTNGSPAATSLKHDCTSTPVIHVCGSVPVTASTINSGISANRTTILADGSSQSTITVRLKDASGANLTTSGGVVVITTQSGTISSVIDNNDGTYTAILTSATAPGTTTIGYSINGTTAPGTTAVNFVTILPLTWQNVTAFRQGKSIKIIWTTTTEVNTKSFDIERSPDGINWVLIVSGIPATNQPGTHAYEQTDSAYTAQRVYYRIIQWDIDGRYTYSPVRIVAALTDHSGISVYPVPAQNYFHLAASSASSVKKVQLISVSGNILKTWTHYQSAYDIGLFPRGNYLLRVETTENVQVLKMVK